MSNSLSLAAEQSLSLLESLRHTVTEFAHREEALSREIASKRYHLQRDQRDTLHQEDNRIAARLSAADAVTQRAEEHVRNLYHARRGVIQRIHHSVLGDVQLNARKAKEKFLSELQVRHFTAKKNLPGEFEAADAAYAEFSTRLKEQRSAYVRLEQDAAHAVSGHAGLLKLLRREPHPANEKAANPEELLKKFQDQMNATAEETKTFRKLPLPAFFRGISFSGWAVVLLAGSAVLGFILRKNPAGFYIAGGLGVGLMVIIAILHRLAFGQGLSQAQKVAAALGEAVRLHDECRTAATLKHAADRQALQDHYDQTKTDIDSQWHRGQEIEDEFTQDAEEKFENQIPRTLATADRILTARLARISEEGKARRGGVEKTTSAERQDIVDRHARENAELDGEETAKWVSLKSDWEREMKRHYDEIARMTDSLAPTSPELNQSLANNWTAPSAFTSASRFGTLLLDLAPIAPKAERLPLPGPAVVEIPVALSFPDQGSLVIEARESGTAAISGTLNLLILRLLATMPPGKVSFTILDPVGLGHNFAGLMHLADYEENLINRRIWTQRDQIDERLAELNEHIEKVIQMYLRNEFATISEYNAQAGSVAEKYHFLIIADFPGNFGENAVKRLQSIISSGPRCGVFTFLHWDQRQPVPDGLAAEDFRKQSVTLRLEHGAPTLGLIQSRNGATLRLDTAPDPTIAAALVHKIGQASVDSNRVEVPFSQISPKPEEYWTNETTHELRIPIGRTGATKMQYLSIGKGTRQHALFAGKTGSGKSTLFHVIITNLALSCSPEQVEFYLIDFKKGVEFKAYANKHLPHARVIAIESDREFGLSVLHRVDEELKRRGDMFRKLGVQDIAGYKKAGGREPMPRSLLIIDEFQEFFTEDDAIAQGASMLFDRIVRQGRAFGIHVLLGSQTLGGAYTLARATLGQMVIRVALQCNEADAYLIMDENNAAPRLLSRPGEGIYNDAAGAIEGNSPFQVVWLPDEERDRLLGKIESLALQRDEHPARPIVFEGNAPSDIEENTPLVRALSTVPEKAPINARAWLGAPNSIKGPTEAVFHRQSGNHLLMVGQREETALSLLAVSAISLAAQYPVGTAKFYFLHASVPGSSDAEFIEKLPSLVPHEMKVGSVHEAADLLAEISADHKARAAGETPEAPEVFVIIHGLPRFKKLRYEDDFSFGGSSDAGPGAQLNELISEGSSHGIHLLVSVDTFSNLNRFLNRKALGEFEMRVVFQMSANDSASLIDSPKASDLGLHRALLYNESQGQLETFRPYAMPGTAWFEKAAELLKGRRN